ncbi:hypothetical protein LCGC14_2219190 [marine sediment metagenome]|uniref:Uncharacterized protein n=1 Tax=marine sediment metagenome TaxID=412755 RepID=A0A0F9DBL6_9ZZZZ
MSCGIICRQDAYSPRAELERIRRFVGSLPGVPRKSKPDQFERWLFGGFSVLCVIWGISILGLFAYGAISTIVAAVS